MTSVLRSAPWRRAPVLFLKQPAVALVVGATAIILGVSAAAAPLYLASVGSASVSLQMAQRCVSSLGDVAVGSGPLSGVGQAQGSLKTLSAHRSHQPAPRARRSLGNRSRWWTTSRPVEQVVARTAQPAQLATTTGGLSHIQVLSSNGRPGVWVSDDYAACCESAGGTLLLHFDDPDAPPFRGFPPFVCTSLGSTANWWGPRFRRSGAHYPVYSGRLIRISRHLLSSSPTGRHFGHSYVRCTSTPSAS